MTVLKASIFYFFSLDSFYFLIFFNNLKLFSILISIFLIYVYFSFLYLSHPEIDFVYLFVNLFVNLFLINFLINFLIYFELFYNLLLYFISFSILFFVSSFFFQILCMRCPYFHRMFTGEYVESRETEVRMKRKFIIKKMKITVRKINFNSIF